MKKLITICIALVSVLGTTGCNQNPIGSGESAQPKLPAEASMTIPSIGNQAPLAKSAATTLNNAFPLAYLTVSFWTSGIQLALLEPRALFAICQSAKPTPLADNSGWQWHVSDNKGFSAILTGRVVNSSVEWTMSVSGGNLHDFVWFSGTSTITGNQGSWTFYDTAKVNGTSQPVIQIEYAINSAKSSVTVTDCNQTTPRYGSFLRWAKEGNQLSFEAFGAEKQEIFIIVWDTITEAGSIANMMTGETFCWDTKQNDHQDIPCK